MLEVKFTKIGLDKGLEDFKQKHGFTFEGDALIKKTQDYVFRVSFDFLSIGKFIVGVGRIRIKEVEERIEPLLKKYSIPVSEQDESIADGDEYSFTHTLDASSEDELRRSILIVNEYLEKKVIPFFNKYSNMNDIMQLIESKTDKELLKYFQGPQGIFKRLLIAKMNRPVYYNEKFNYYSNLFLSSSKETYQTYYKVLQDLNNTVN